MVRSSASMLAALIVVGRLVRGARFYLAILRSATSRSRPARQVSLIVGGLIGLLILGMSSGWSGVMVARLAAPYAIRCRVRR